MGRDSRVHRLEDDFFSFLDLDFLGSGGLRFCCAAPVNRHVYGSIGYAVQVLSLSMTDSEIDRYSDAWLSSSSTVYEI